jgi:predicted aspartyl protease
LLQMSLLCRGIFTVVLMLIAPPGCDFLSSGKVQEQVSTTQNDIDLPVSPKLLEVEQHWQDGTLSTFVKTALNSEETSGAIRLELMRIEALLASGRPDQAEAIAAKLCKTSPAASDRPTQVAAHKLRLIAQLRQQKSPTACAHLTAGSLFDPGLAPIARWQQALDERTPYQIAGDPATVPLQKTAIWSGLLSHDLESIEAHVNGKPMPTAFIDTGAQWTVITTEAATQAGVKIGDARFPLIGFSSTEARPAVLNELTIGTMTIRDVPVLVADTKALAAANGQLTIGRDLLVHLVVTIDPQDGVVTVGEAKLDEGSAPKGVSDENTWMIPIWNFSAACLAEAEFNGGSARVLIDTGNSVGTFISGRWAERVLPEVRLGRRPPTLWFKGQRFELPEFELAGQKIAHWPVVDSLPAELERLDAIDLVIGRDLFGAYRTTIDLRNRRLVLSDGPLPPTPLRRKAAADSAASGP